MVGRWQTQSRSGAPLRLSILTIRVVEKNVDRVKIELADACTADERLASIGSRDVAGRRRKHPIIGHAVIHKTAPPGEVYLGKLSRRLTQ